LSLRTILRAAMGTKRQSQAIAVDRDHDGQPETGRLIGRVLRAQSGFFPSRPTRAF